MKEFAFPPSFSRFLHLREMGISSLFSSVATQEWKNGDSEREGGNFE